MAEGARSVLTSEVKPPSDADALDVELKQGFEMGGAGDASARFARRYVTWFNSTCSESASQDVGMSWSRNGAASSNPRGLACMSITIPASLANQIG